MDENWWSPAVSLDDAGPQSGNENPNANLVSSSYFPAMGIPLVTGRDFSLADGAGKQQVAIVNEAFAQKFFPGRDPVGHRIGLGNDPGTRTASK